MIILGLMSVGNDFEEKKMGEKDVRPKNPVHVSRYKSSARVLDMK
jgi:hypothetical protein